MKADDFSRCPLCMGLMIKGVPVSNSSKHSTCDGNVVIYKRKGSPVWQARYKLPEGTWHRISTKKTSTAEALVIGADAYTKAQYLHEAGVPAISRRFRDASKLANQQMRSAVKAGQGKKTYADYERVIQKYLNPFFGNYRMDKITYEVVEKFEEWRIAKMKRQPVASTLNTHNSALARVFDVAVTEGWMSKKQVPVLKNRGAKGERRPAFTEAEWDQIVVSFPQWIKATNVKKSVEIRELLFSYVLILAFSGIRPGIEADNLKWSHLSWHLDKGERFLVLHVNGKTGKRQSIAGNECIVALERLQRRFPEFAKYSFDELIARKVNEHIFRLRSGKRTKGMTQAFHDFLTAHGLLKDVHGENRSLYSLRHTYATVNLTRNKVSIHQLAKQMGTSVTMIEKHYSHLTPVMVAKQFSGKKLPATASAKRQAGPEQGETLEEYEVRNPGDPYDTV